MPGVGRHCRWAFIRCSRVTTALLWIVVIVCACETLPIRRCPGPTAVRHTFWAWLAAWDMLLTAVTGWIFYWLAFVA